MQTNMPREIKDIIRNVQQMDLPENGIADIRIKIQGGDVMDRPMFKKGGGANKFPDLSGDGKVTQKDILIGRGVIEKQEGGAVSPEQAIAQVEVAAEAEGEQLGLDYLAKQMGGIDMAEDAEGLINALRGNEMPIAARRTELAEYVGEEDAMRTPESVLAMVQPTIMMTEEGAMNSGIGELMQQLTSDVEMATEGGAPTDMGQGVGALMMAGAPGQPVQQFAAGGAVQGFQDGGGPLEELYGEYLPLYQNLIAKSDEEREKDRALALARAGFQFASGLGPKGENIAGRPFLSQVGAVAAPVLEEFADAKKSEREQEIAAKTLALKGAIDTSTAQKTADLKFQRDVILEGIKADMKGVKPVIMGQVPSLLGNPINIYGLPDENNVLQPIPQSQLTGQPLVASTGQTISDANQIPLGETPAESRKVVQAYLKQYEAGDLEGEALQRFESSIEAGFPFEVKDGRNVFKVPLDSKLVEAITVRSLGGQAVGLRPEILEEAQRVAVNLAETNPRFVGGALSPDALADPETREILQDRGAIRPARDLDAEVTGLVDVLEGVDITKGPGAYNQLVRTLGSKVDQAADIFGGIIGKNIDPGIATEEIAAFNALRTLAVQNLMILLESQPGRDNVQLQEKMESLLTNIEQQPSMSPSAFARLLETSLLYNKQVQQSLTGGKALEDLTEAEFNSVKQIAGIGRSLERVIETLQAQADPQTSGPPSDLSRFLITPETPLGRIDGGV